MVGGVPRSAFIPAPWAVIEVRFQCLPRFYWLHLFLFCIDTLRWLILDGHRLARNGQTLNVPRSTTIHTCEKRSPFRWTVIANCSNFVSLTSMQNYFFLHCSFLERANNSRQMAKMLYMPVVGTFAMQCMMSTMGTDGQMDGQYLSEHYYFPLGGLYAF